MRIIPFSLNYFLLQILFNNAEYICRPCWVDVLEGLRQFRHIEQPPNVENVEDPPLVDNDPHQEVNQVIELLTYSRPPNTSNACIFFECRHRTRHRISDAKKNNC